jgi:3-oxoacyl-[acyl-carrier-protein] synthase-3
MAGRLLAADTAGGQDGQAGPLALILSGEKAFTREAQMFADTTVFGEGAAACLVSAFGASDRRSPTCPACGASSTGPLARTTRGCS